MAPSYAKKGGTWPSVLCGADEGAGTERRCPDEVRGRDAGAEAAPQAHHGRQGGPGRAGD